MRLLGAAHASKEAGAAAKQEGYMPINVNYPGLRLVHSVPPIYWCSDFLTAEECDQLIAAAHPRLRRSTTVGPTGSNKLDKGRTSSSCTLAKTQEPCSAILNRIQALTNKPQGTMEPPQVARYTDNQRYDEHCDAVDPHSERGRAFCANGGQRVATVLLYLNDVPGGGGTYFRLLNFEARPKKGAALIFFPAFLNGEVVGAALHAGMPPVGTKWVSQVWIRQFLRQDGQPSTVLQTEHITEGPTHEGINRGRFPPAIETTIQAAI